MNLLDLARSAVLEAAILEAPAQSLVDDARNDPDVARRRSKVLALLDQEPSRRIAVVAEAPRPGEAVGHVCTAIRCVVVGELEVPADKYDALALLTLMDQYGNA